MASANTNRALSTARGGKDRTAVAGGGSQQFRYLRTTDRLSVAYYVLQSIDRAMERAGIQSLSNQQGKTSVFVAKAASKLRLMRNVRRSSAGLVFVSFMGFSESKTFPFSCWNEIVPHCFD